MAAADLLVVILDPLLTWTALFHFQQSFLYITTVCKLKTFMGFAINAVSVWLTVAFTFDRFVAICCDNMKAKYCTERTAAAVIGAVSALICVESVPWYFLYEYGILVDNIPWYCIPSLTFLQSFAWGAYEMFHFIFTSCAPFVIILFLNVLTARRILVSTRIRSALRSCRNGKKIQDVEMQNRRKSVILLFSISGCFILLWGAKIGHKFYVRITGNYMYTSTLDPSFITEHVSTMLQLLSTCTNTCIYVASQNQFRKALMHTLTYAIHMIRKLYRIERSDLKTHSHSLFPALPPRCEMSRK
ncbi:G-protein coupled receptor 15-like [Narcine bancroftii]|uniref:G-protein coupled receptor 15-like n=1 Tax=Narcine bancroftii TaxID=1343680 RepID=UPI003831BE73